MNMHLKNIIVFICLATCILRCRGVDPTSKQLKSIKDIVAEKVGQDGIDFDEIKDVFTIVANSLGMSKVLYGIDELKINFMSRYKMKFSTLVFVTIETKPELLAFIIELIKPNVEPDYIDVDELNNVLNKVASKAGLSKVPSIDELQWTVSDSARKYLKKEVIINCLALVSSEDPIIEGIVENNIQKHENPNGMAYEDLKNVVDGVRHELGIQRPFKDYEKFKSQLLLRKHTAKEVEKIIVDNLFEGSFSV